MGKREERLREALNNVRANLCSILPTLRPDMRDFARRTVAMADDALASSPSPPEPQCRHDDNPEMIWVTRSSLEAALSPPDREQAVEKVAKELAECGCEESPGLWKDCVDRPGYEMKARAIVAALFGRGDES